MRACPAALHKLACRLSDPGQWAICLLLGALGAASGLAQSSEPAEVGAWGCLHDWSNIIAQTPPGESPECAPYTGPTDLPGLPAHHPINEISHAALLPVGPHAGKVLLWAWELSTQSTRSYLFDPTIEGCSPSALQTLGQTLCANIFCSGHTFLSDGSLLVVGGVPGGSEYNPTQRKVYRFHPRSLLWTEVADLTKGRYYPTAILMNRRPLATQDGLWQTPGGSALVLGGPKFITGPLGQPLWETLSSIHSPWQGIYPPSTEPNDCQHEHLPTPHGYAYDVVAPATCVDVPLDSYPRALQLSSGDIFIAGDVDTQVSPSQDYGSTPSGRTWFIRTPDSNAEGAWELHGGPWMGPMASPDPEDAHKRLYASPVLIHELAAARRNRVLNFGGLNREPHPFAPEELVYRGTTAVEELSSILDPGSDPFGQWNEKASTIFEREFGNSVLLPTREVLLIGGLRKLELEQQQLLLNVPAATPEIYDPGNDSDELGSTREAAMAPLHPSPFFGDAPIPRGYHNVALLLPDGRVLVAGGSELGAEWPSSKHTAEIYSPPYLFQGQRPGIDDSPAEVQFNTSGNPSTFKVKVSAPVGDGLHRVVLLRPGSVTHHFDADQRYIELGFTSTIIGYAQSSDPNHPTLTLYELTVTAPDETLGPPGWYMLFVLSQKPNPEHRVPSVGHFIRFL